MGKALAEQVWAQEFVFPDEQGAETVRDPAALIKGSTMQEDT